MRETWGQFHQHSTSSFYARRSQNPIKLLNFTVFFALLGSASVKAARRTLVKLNPGFSFYIGEEDDDQSVLSRSTSKQDVKEKG